MSTAPLGSRPGPATGHREAAAGGREWVVDAGQVWAMGAGLVLLVVGALLGRPDAALLGVPAVLGSAWTLVSRPGGRVRVDARLAPSSDGLHALREAAPAPEGAGGSGVAGHGDVSRGDRLETVTAVQTLVAGGSLVARLDLHAPPGAGTVRVRAIRPGHRAAEAVVHVPLVRRVDVTATSVRTGAQPLFVVVHQGIGAGRRSQPGREDAGTVLVLPKPRRVARLPLPGRLRGLTGQHESRRPGSGGELRDVHPFQPGDSPRRVDWKVTARRSPRLEELYVRRTMALGEAVVTVVVDSRDDVGPDPATWSGYHAIRADDATSLDIARQAAASLAQGYLATGDRVGIEDLGVRRRAVRPGTGRRQLDRVLQQLAALRPEGEPPDRLRPPRVAAGALIYVLSTFLDPEAAVLARGWRRVGHTVVAVDVLPRLRLRGLDRRHRIALRMVRLERQDRLAELEASGVEVVRWVDEEAATAHLQRLSRLSHRRPVAGTREVGAGHQVAGRRTAGRSR